MPADDVTVVVGDRRVPPAELTEDDGWWFQQDRVALAVPHELAPGTHDVAVEFGLRIPYLQVGPDGPLTLPFRAARPLVIDAPRAPPAVATSRPDADAATAPTIALPPGWVLSASAFNWTPEMIAGERDAVDIAVGHRRERPRAVEIEAEPGQLWRSFPGRSEADAAAFGARLTAAGGRVSILGASIDDWSPQGTRRTDDERFDVPPAADRDRAPARRARRAPADRAGGPTPAGAGPADPARDRA